MRALAYYNEVDPFAAQWLRNLITGGHIAPGDVDERSIVDVRPDDLAGYAQAHFFAGIGGWSLALRLAGWPDDRPVWTGSCPCQPFSAAGKRKGTADARHLWPEFRRLIAECDPPVVFGEQVASKDGREWLAGVRADLEDMAYAVGAADLCVASVGAPHIRQRLWWVADAYCARQGADRRDDGEGASEPEHGAAVSRRGGADGRVADADGGLSGNGGLQPGGQHGQQPQDGGARRLADSSDAERWPVGRPEQDGHHGADAGRAEAYRLAGARGAVCNPASWMGDWIPCTDGKARRTQSGLQPLAHGVPNRVGRLRGYGNAIVPPLAAEFIGAFLDLTDDYDPMTDFSRSWDMAVAWHREKGTIPDCFIPKRKEEVS